MATETSLSQLVKGAPPPDIKLPPVAPLPPLAQSSTEVLSAVTKQKTKAPTASPTDRNSNNRKPHLPTEAALQSTLPSSPTQIYLNLLILEASLRSQYLHLLSRRRLNTFFLLLLLLWNIFFTWALFFRPREDGTGLGGSVYWVIETGEKVFFMGGIVTVLLVKATGQWERGIRWPRRWLGTTNRGLRGFNLRVVVTKGRWWHDIFSPFAFLLPSGLWRDAGGSGWHWVEHENGIVVEEDLAKGGDHIMLLLLPKNFSSEFRENWEGYRTEYWERENERRHHLRKKVKAQQRNKAKEAGGWKWWTGLWHLTASSDSRPKRRGQDLEKHPHSHHHHQNNPLTKDGQQQTKQSRRRSVLRDSSHSRQSSRSSTPHALTFPDLDGSAGGALSIGGGLGDANTNKPLSERVRRGSSVSSTSSVRRNTLRSSGGGTGSTRRADGILNPLTAADMNEDSSGRDKERRMTRKRERERLKERPGTGESAGSAETATGISAGVGAGTGEGHISDIIGGSESLPSTPIKSNMRDQDLDSNDRNENNDENGTRTGETLSSSPTSMTYHQLPRDEPNDDNNDDRERLFPPLERPAPA